MSVKALLVVTALSVAVAAAGGCSARPSAPSATSTTAVAVATSGPAMPSTTATTPTSDLAATTTVDVSGGSLASPAAIKARHDICVGMVPFFTSSAKLNAGDPTWTLQGAVESLIADEPNNPAFVNSSPDEQAGMIAGARDAEKIVEAGGDGGQCA